MSNCVSVENENCNNLESTVTNLLQKNDDVKNYFCFNLLPKWLLFLLTCSITLIMYCKTSLRNTSEISQLISEMRIMNEDLTRAYLIYTPTCKIVNVDAYNKEVEGLVWREENIKCSENSGLLTYVDKSSGVIMLNIRNDLRINYSYFRIHCCYSKISLKDENHVSFSDCIPFEDPIEITDPLIQVTCSNLFRIVYVNVHAIINPNVVRQRYIKNENLTRFSVIFVGVDSMSHNNLIRTMPKTKQFLDDNDYINLKGYTKVGDNTFPNLVAFLIGRNWTQVYDHCQPRDGDFNKCEVIWDKFKSFEYVTAYAEDFTEINTFNYGRHGFNKPPTDFYFRPYMLAVEKLKHKYVASSRFYCTGPENTASRILNVAEDFIFTFRNISKFGFFWMSTISHDDVNLPSTMDDRFVEFLTEIQSSLQDTFFFFISDHGIRFGPIRKTFTGYIEERLPYMYIHVPESFKTKFSSEYKNLQINVNRLTSPFDIYLTLQDILALANDSYIKQRSIGCPTCQSLFTEISENRTCKDSAISQEWCLCHCKFPLNTNNPVAVKVANFLISKLNDHVKSFNESNECTIYNLKKIKSAGWSPMKEKELRSYAFGNILLSIEAQPSAEFEATIEIRNEIHYRVLGEISRLDKYKTKSECVKDIFLKKYCYCKNKI